MIKGTIFDADMCGIWDVVKGWLSLRQSLGGFWLATILHEKGIDCVKQLDTVLQATVHLLFWGIQEDSGD